MLDLLRARNVFMFMVLLILDSDRPLDRCFYFSVFYSSYFYYSGTDLEFQKITITRKHAGAKALQLKGHPTQSILLSTSVCSSVRLSNACIVTKRKNSLSIFQYHTIEQCLYFLEAKFCNPAFSGSPRTSVFVEVVKI